MSIETKELKKGMDYSDFKDKFGEWAPMFRNFIESQGMADIYQRIKKDAMTEVIAPDSEDTFRAFSTCKPEDLKVVWYLMDPYPKRYRNKEFQATGIAMDCSNTPDEKIQPSLEYFYKTMSKDIKEEVEMSPSLEYLQDQGVMLLNTDLTCKLNKTGSHLGMWDPFQEYFLQEVLRSTTGMIYILSGKASQRMEKYITPVGNYIFKTDHPVHASYTKTEWDSKNVFNKVNKLLKENNKEQIYWNKKTWDMVKELPF